METKNFKSVKSFKKFIQSVEYLPTNVNRKIYDTNVNNIIRSILQIGVQRTIIVVKTNIFTEDKSYKLYFLDAQHLGKAILRIEDAKLFGMRTVNVIELHSYGEIVKHISLLNSVGKARNLSQYLDSWVFDQKPAYLRFYDLLKETKYSINSLIECLTQQKSTGNSDFKDGNFNPTKKQVKQGLRIISLHQNLMKTGLKHTQNSFSALVRFCIDNPHIDHDTIYKNVKKSTKLFKEVKSRDVFIANLKLVCEVK
jgi:hypothetical protein